jgi:hypothetical protein
MSYGRNFGFRVTPDGGDRSGRYYNDDNIPLVIGAPVVITGNDDGLGRLGVELATGDQAAPLPGKGGILVYEWIQFLGVDPVITTYSDFGTAPIGKAVQVVSGPEVKVELKNTTQDSFLARADYPTPRVMVAGLGATPTISVGDKLTPGVGNDTDGYWAETSTTANAWLIVTYVDVERGLVEARLNF